LPRGASGDFGKGVADTTVSGKRGEPGNPHAQGFSALGASPSGECSFIEEQLNLEFPCVEQSGISSELWFFEKARLEFLGRQGFALLRTRIVAGDFFLGEIGDGRRPV
jgi:hypothetical protein